MKVSMVSYISNNFRGSLPQKTEKEVLPFLYNINSKAEDYNYKHESKLFIGTVAFLAATAVCVTLINMSSRRKFPLNIVDDFGGEVLGLNKLGDQYKKTSKVLKEKVLYPLKSELLGDKDFMIGKDLKLGIIIKDSDSKKLKNFMDAFTEHVEKLGINFRDINKVKAQNNLSDKQAAYRMINDAEKYYQKKKKFTVINLDNIRNLTNFEGVKTTNSTMDKKLVESINYKEPKGIIWVGWKLEDKGTIPDFYSKQQSVLITDLAN